MWCEPITGKICSCSSIFTWTLLLLDSRFPPCLHNRRSPHTIKRYCHYENTPIQIYRQFHLRKLKIFQIKSSDIFHITAQNIDCGYSLEPPRRGGSNEYPQSMFLSRNKKIMYTPANPSFTI